MSAKAGIKKEAVLVGLLDRFEIWNPKRYEAVAESDRMMAAEAFRMME
jgi:DNA-binding transcriptional regulator/RsmH inhibitor MraZ